MGFYMRISVIGYGGAGRSHVRGYIENGISIIDVYLCNADVSRCWLIVLEVNI